MTWLYVKRFDSENWSWARCDTFLAIIGPRWLEKGRRLDDPDDSVRFEIAAALNRDNIPVIPILLDGPKIPRRDQLPSDLQAWLIGTRRISIKSVAVVHRGHRP